VIVPIAQVGVVIGSQGPTGGGNEIFRPSQPPNPPRPTINLPTIQPTIGLPTARPTISASFSRTIATSFSRTIQTSFTFSPTLTWTTTTNYWYSGMVFIHYGAGYSASTGSFTLGQALYDQNNSPCLYYDYFEFNAPGGLTIQARLWTTGTPIHYIVVPMAVVSLFQSSGCNALGALTQANTIGSTSYLYSWTAPQNGQYAIIFYSTTPYTDPIYFLPQ